MNQNHPPRKATFDHWLTLRITSEMAARVKRIVADNSVMGVRYNESDVLRIAIDFGLSEFEQCAAISKPS